MVPHDIPSEEKILVCSISRKNYGYSLLGFERCELRELPAWGQQWTLSAMLKHLESWKFAFIRLVSQKKMSGMLLRHDNARPHTSVCVPGRLSQNLDEQCSNILPMFWHHTIKFLLVWAFERQRARTQSCEWQGTVECCEPEGAKEGEQLLPGRDSCCCWKVKEECWQRWWLHCAQINAVKLWNFHMSNLEIAWNKIQEAILSD